MLRAFFSVLSTSRRVRRFAERSAIGRRLASRFVAGRSVAEALEVCARVNAQGMAASLDSLGESVTSEEEARATAAVYHELLDAIGERRLRANISLKLTQMGLDIAPAVAEEIVAGLAEHAAQLRNFIRIDMEGSAYTETTIAMTERLHTRFPGHLGTVLQAYLRRTEADTERLLGKGIRIRLCKGAYKEGPQLAFPSKADVDANYVRLMERMLTSGVFCGIATHDEAIVKRVVKFSKKAGVAVPAFEFQMLYGVRRDLQRRLVEQGFGVRVYVPFGTAWYPYFMRRLAERPANVLFLVKNLFR